MSDPVHRHHETPHGTSLLPRDLTEDQLAEAPVLASVDALLIEELSDDEDDAFAAALDSCLWCPCAKRGVPRSNKPVQEQ